MVAGFRAAAESVTPSAPPTQRKKAKKGGGEGDRFTARNFAADYLRLCQHPTKDLRRWLAEDKKHKGAASRRNERTPTRETTHDRTQNPPLATADRLCRQPLQHLRGGLDADRREWRQADDLLARSRTGAQRYDGLRSVRAEGHAAGPLTGAGTTSAPETSFKGERAALLALYGAKIEATRRSLPASAVAAAVRAIRDERQAVLRAFAAQRQARTILRREQNAAERFSARLAQPKARDGPEPRPS